MKTCNGALCPRIHLALCTLVSLVLSPVVSADIQCAWIWVGPKACIDSLNDTRCVYGEQEKGTRRETHRGERLNAPMIVVAWELV